MEELTNKLKELTKIISKREELESELESLKKNKEDLKIEKEKLYSELEKENKDVEVLENDGIKSHIYELIGVYDKKLDIEKDDVHKVKTKYNTIENSYKEAVNRIEHCKIELGKLSEYEYEYNKLFTQKRKLIENATDKSEFAEIQALEDKIEEYEKQVNEVREALYAGRNVIKSIDKILDLLGSANNWGLMDLLGGGFISDMVKYSKVDDAEDSINDLKYQLSKYKSELSDVEINTNLSVNNNGFLKFTDIVFDDIFSGLKFRDNVNDSLDNVRKLQSKVKDIQNTLNTKNDRLKTRIEESKKSIEKLIIEA